MERRQLEYLVAVVENASFTRAAAALNVSQPALSKSVRQLEHELHLQLFRRTGREILVTPAAEELAVRARLIIRDFDALARAASVQGGPAGRTEVAASPATAIEPMSSVVKELQEHRPAITVSSLACQNAAEVISNVDRGRCEVGLCGQLTRPVGRRLVCKEIGSINVVLLSPPGMPATTKSTVKASDLEGRQFVLPPPRTTIRQVFDTLMEAVGDYTVAVEVGHRQAILPMVLRGIGHALHSSELIRTARQSGAEVRLLEPNVPVPIWLIHHRELSAASAEFVATTVRVANRPT